MADINKSIAIDVEVQGDGSLEKAVNNIEKLDDAQSKSVKSTQDAARAQGTMADSVLKNGGAIAVLDQLTGGMASAFKDATEAVELTGVSMKGLRGAIIATGIGVLVIVIGELVANWDKWIGMIDGSTAAMERLNAAMKENELNMVRTNTNHIQQITNLEEEIRLMKARGDANYVGKEIELNKVRLKQQDQIVSNAKEALELQGQLLDRQEQGTKEYDEALKKFLDAELTWRKAEADRKKLANDPTVEAAAEATAKRNKANADALAKQNKITQEQNAQLEKQKAIIESISAETQKFNDSQLSATYIQIRDLSDKWKEINDNMKGANKETKKLAEDSKVAIVKEIELLKQRAILDEESNTRVQEKKDQIKQLEISGYSEFKKKKEQLRIEAEIAAEVHGRDLARFEERKTLINDELATTTENSARWFELKDQLTDITHQQNDELRQMQSENLAYGIDLAALEIENEKQKDDTIFENHKAALEAQKQADEEYANSKQIIAQNLEGFLGALQNESLIKDRKVRNLLLIAEKGLAIAGVVTNTIKTNREAASLATIEKAKSLASAASYDYVGAGLHAGASAKSLASIPLNWAGAGISIAGIAATTLTSWNKGGGGESGGGAAPNPQAQFNIVGQSGTNQLAESIAGQQKQTVKAFVVSSEVTTAQSLDRNKIENSTFL